MKNIQQRFDTILRVSKAIVERQKSFFTHGEIAMKPLVLREIADELGLHESPSRASPPPSTWPRRYGTFELKYFFGSSLNTEAGGNASSTAVRALIRQLVAPRTRPSRCRTASSARCSRSRASRSRGAPWPSTARR
jgi:RNA polymerase sigma-54 factor